MTSHSIEGLSDGCVLVPREPTEAMTAAGRKAFATLPLTLDPGQDPSRVARTYRAMLSAAPERVEGGGWLPIESAPRDGTVILAFCVHPNARLAGEDCAEWTEIVTTRWIDFNGGGWIDEPFTWDDYDAAGHAEWERFAEIIGKNIRQAVAAPELLAAARVVMAGLLERIDAAPKTAVPVFAGFAELHAAIFEATPPPPSAEPGEGGSIQTLEAGKPLPEGDV